MPFNLEPYSDTERRLMDRLLDYKATFEREGNAHLAKVAENMLRRQVEARNRKIEAAVETVSP